MALILTAMLPATAAPAVAGGGVTAQHARLDRLAPAEFGADPRLAAAAQALQAAVICAMLGKARPGD